MSNADYAVKFPGDVEWSPIPGILEDAFTWLANNRSGAQLAQVNCVGYVTNLFNDAVFVVVIDRSGRVESISTYEQFYGAPYVENVR